MRAILVLTIALVGCTAKVQPTYVTGEELTQALDYRDTAIQVLLEAIQDLKARDDARNGIVPWLGKK